MLSHLVIISSAKTLIRRTVIKIGGLTEIYRGLTQKKPNRFLSSVLGKIYLSNSFSRILKVFRAIKTERKSKE